MRQVLFGNALLRYFVLFSAITLTISQSYSREFTTLRGKVMGFDERPMKKANIVIYKIYSDEIVSSCEAIADGSFSLNIPMPGQYKAIFYGVNNSPFSLPIILEENEDIEIKVTLGSHRLKNNFDLIRLAEADYAYSLMSARRMKKIKDGTFISEFYCDAIQYVYKISGASISDELLNGTFADNYEFDGKGYRSIVYPKNNKVKILFNPLKLLSEKKEGDVEFTNQKSKSAKYAAIYLNLKKMDDADISSWDRLDKQDSKYKKFKFAWKDIISKLNKEYFNEETEFNKQCRKFIYLCLLRFDIGIPNPQMIMESLYGIGPKSPLWSLDPEILHFIYGYANESAKEDVEDYLNNILQYNNEREVFANALYLKISIAYSKGEYETVDILISLLEMEYPKSKWITRAKRDFKLPGQALQ